MDDCSSTHTFPSHHHLHHHPSFYLNLPSLQSPEVDYSPAPPALDPSQQYGSRGDESIPSFTVSGSSSQGRKGSNRGERGLLNTSGSGLDASLGSHFDGESGHFDDSWYGGVKKEETWDDGESCESAADEFYSKMDCYRNPNDALNSRSCSIDDSVGPRGKANYNSFSHAGYEPKTETTYDIESHFAKQTASGRFSEGGLDYCRMDSVGRDTYLGREEDYGSSSGSGEDQLQSTEVELSPWLNISAMNQSGEGRWKRGAHGLLSSFPPQRSPVGTNSRTYTQKLDSFKDAFLSQHKRKFPVVACGDSSGQMWEYGKRDTPGSIKSRLSCAFDSDTSLPPSSSSPAHPCLPSFPSPPTSSHLMASVLSPPPTPLPPPPHSPSKMDSPCTLGASTHSQGGETLGTLQFFPSRLQSLPPLHSEILWKFPVLTHCFPQSSGDCSSIEGNQRSSHGSSYSNSAAPHDVIQSPELSLLPSPSHRPVIHSVRPSYPSLHPHPSHSPGSYYMAGGSGVPYMVAQKVRNGPADVSQQEDATNSTGTSFPSILQSSRGQMRTRYTPRPFLNPCRRGAGLYSSLSSVHRREAEAACGEHEEECAVLPCINVGPDFQADVPPCTGDGSEVWPTEEMPKEQLLWKPWDELTESKTSQDQVEKLLSMCNSSCLPGGGSNTELALHCLHSCQGNTMATLEMLLFSKPAPTGDYHYSGTDYWTDGEKSLFGAALETFGKEFSLIHVMVKTKTVHQCVEFYYLSKKLRDKQKKLKEEENKDTEVVEQKRVTPICQPIEKQMGPEEAVPVPSLSSFFPCKLCGKIFYKIKSRNAHMKIHRQPQEDWSDRRLQQQILTQRLALTRPSNLMPGSNLLLPLAPALTFSSSGLAGTSSSNKNANNVITSITSSNNISPSDSSILDHSPAVTYSNINSANSHVIASIDSVDPSQREPGTFQQTWGSYEHTPDPPSFYCNTEVKDRAQTGGVKEPIKWL